MKLADWLKMKKLPRYKFAEQIGVQPSVVTDYCRSQYRPSARTIEKIIHVTSGDVTANDFLSAEAQQILSEAAE